ncbi:treslin isoform X2 [Canis lupus familiaris]|uniref:TOPBP1 interacting checkpoint and replication regulator n=2 Tax=Canis lupus familiaris TaxID=9615 RepID=A0A8C0MAH8_CANLF|nr:treslin isoform X2 [Canis lupus familiaris]XP_851592.2 treslin isoform X2 [Canis lupus familiaris]|eukprot:XP_851592.2 treslin isoform X1 [Canis lupus familiaris]
MACCHNVMLLLDTAGGAAGRSSVRRAALRLLTYLSCRFGLARVRWAFKFFDSQGARGRQSRVSDFRELGARSWEDFEEELDARLGAGAHGAHLPGPAPRASHTHGALMETLLDYQWDRPEITSPTKPILRSSGRRLLDVEGEAREAEAALGGFVNAVFLLAPCPHSQRELLQFVSGCEAQAQRLPPPPRQVMEKLLPKRVQEVMIARKITLYWLDTTEWPKLWESPDHVGYWTMCELLHLVGGTILPSETFSQDCAKAGKILLGGEKNRSTESPLSSWISILPPDATLNCLLYNSPAYEASFPRTEGTLFLPLEGKEIQETWTVTLEPLAMHQRHFQKPVRIFLKGTASQWCLPASSSLGTDSWMLQSPEENKSTQKMLFQQLISRLTAEEVHLVASVDPGEGWPPITGVISPLSTNATILTVFRTEEAEFQRHFFQTVVAESSQDTASPFFDVMDIVLHQIHNSLEDPATCAPLVPEWAQQELGRTDPWNAAVVEKWFPSSNLSGASSSLMESFWLLQAASSNKEESSKTENELTCCLSELYQRKSREESSVSNQEDSKKKRGVPRTPVRQKMNTMCRSLKMLNVARLNVKAQKLCPDGSPDAAGEKGSRRTADKLENRGRILRSSKPKDFKTEEDLLSYIHENYQKTVAAGEITLHSCARNMISTIKAFLKSKGTKELEMTCLNQVKNSLLKTSKSLRQNLGGKLDEDKVRECQLQVFLRLELCLQCPSIHESIVEMEQVVKEVTDLLRMVCLTEDSAYLAKFLEEILGLYIDSIPKTLGNLYDSLGFMIPQKLAGVLPLDFFSDDSVTQENISPLLSVPLLSSAHKSVLGGTEFDQLEELRTRSAKKRRKTALIRHKSIAEVSQNLRQIEIPKVSKRATKNETSRSTVQQPPLPVKDPVQEVTKVRRNLFNQEMISPSKRSAKRGLPRSHSVSAVEGLECKLDNFKRTKGYHRLLTRSVAETPVHKQVSRRLLHRQIKGRSSDPGPDIDIVEESPEKGADEVSLRRSPRIKQLSFSRTNSGSFYSGSQPKSRSVQRVHSFQQEKSDQRENSPNQSIRSPKRLLFGAMSEMVSPSEKCSARIQRPSRNSLGSEIPTAYQTPKKSYRKSPGSSKATPQRFLRTPQTPPYTPERRQKNPTEVTPGKQVIFKASLKDCSPGWDSPSPPKVTPQKGCSLAKGGTSPLEKKIPRTPKRPGGQPPGFLNSTWPPSQTSSPENTSSRAAMTRSESLTSSRYALRTPPRAAASGLQRETSVDQKHPHPCVPWAPQVEELAQKWKDKAVSVPKTLESTNLISLPPSPPEKPLTSPLGEISTKSPFWKFSIESPPPEELDWEEPQKAPTVSSSLSCPVPSTPPRTSLIAQSDPMPPLLPSKIGKRQRDTSNLESSSLQRQPSPFAAPRVTTASNPAAITDARKDQKEATLSPQPSPERHSYCGTGFNSDWRLSSPLLIVSDTEYFTLLDEAEHHGSNGLQSHVTPAEEGEASRMVVTCEQPSPSHHGLPSSPQPSSPPTLSYDLRCTADRRQRQAASQLENLQASPRFPKASASPQTYEVELEMQASGLPKLRIKKVDPGCLSEADPPQKVGCLGEESSLPGLSSMSQASKVSGKPEATYMSPPCLRPAHSTPGKSGGQTYICQSCTPTHCPSSTPSPFQTDVGVPWTPSPKHGGKTTPDTIKDWPRRKRAVGGSSAGRSEVGTDFLAGVSLLEPEHRERAGLELSSCRTPLLGDFELEGVCQLPDQSPPRDSVPQAEEAFWGQFGLGSRKRLLPAKEEVECQAKRACDEQRGDTDRSRSEEHSPSMSGRHLPSTGDNEVFISSSTPPAGCAVRSCLSTSSLQALTQSPLLFQGKTPSSRCQEARDEDTEVFPTTAEESPFSRAISRRRPISRTYSRKKLIS